jgi:phenylalanyl-tRNA synthetase beta chain
VVDITNYVMLEYGQPLHAFDFDKLMDRTIIVRAARPGEGLLTLDGERRVLHPPMLTIADANDAVGLAGVMGGASTEMHDGTTAVLLESANFDPVNTRRTSSALRLSTEASYRFERGIRAELAPLALRRATQLILEIAGGKAARGIVDLYPGQKESPVVQISRDRIKQVLGVDFGMAEVERVLTSLGFERSEPEGIADRLGGVDATIWMRVPYWRSDIAIEDDLVEEVARIVGYESIPTTMLSAPVPHHEPQPLRSLKERLRDLLAASGMQETISYSLTSLDTLEKVEALDSGPQPLKIANPMTSGLEYLRTGLRGNVLETLSANRRVSQGEGMRLFETGRVFLPKEEAKERELPDEKEMLVGVLSGPRFSASRLAPQGDMDFFDAKGVLESVLAQIAVPTQYEPSSDPILHPGKTASLVCGGTPVGVVGEVHPNTMRRFDLEGSAVALFEIDLELLARAVPESGRRYESTGRFPEAQRDLALIVDADTSSSRIQAIIERHKLVVRSTPFDVYSGEGIPAGKKSIAYAVVFQSPEATLTAAQVDRAQEDILRQLQRELGAELRG